METALLTISSRLEALIRHDVGWQVDDLRVVVSDQGVVLEGHARCAFAKRLGRIRPHG